MSDVSCRYPELHGLYIKQLRSRLSYSFGRHKDTFEQQLARYFSGELPHSRDVLKSLLQALMGESTASNPRCELGGGHNTIPRVSRPWPARTKRALRISLDSGTFEDIHIATLPGSGTTKHLVYFAGVVDEAVGSPISRCKSPSYMKAS